MCMNVGFNLFIFAFNFLSLVFFYKRGRANKNTKQSNDADLVLLM